MQGAIRVVAHGWQSRAGARQTDGVTIGVQLAPKGFESREADVIVDGAEDDALSGIAAEPVGSQPDGELRCCPTHNHADPWRFQAHLLGGYE